MCWCLACDAIVAFTITIIFMQKLKCKEIKIIIGKKQSMFYCKIFKKQQDFDLGKDLPRKHKKTLKWSKLFQLVFLMRQIESIFRRLF